MDTPKQLNAAQLAKRNIKPVKKPSRRPPLQSTQSTRQQSSEDDGEDIRGKIGGWAAMPSDHPSASLMQSQFINNQAASGFAAGGPRSAKQPANPFNETAPTQPVPFAFGSTPSIGIFGTNQTGANNFGSNSTSGFDFNVQAPVSNPFASGNSATSQQQTSSASNLFGQSAPAPMTNMFGSSQTSNNATSDIFGNQQASRAPLHNIFGNTQTSSPASPAFTFGSGPPANNLFGNTQASTPASPGPSFGTVAPGNNIFGQNQNPSAPAPAGLFGSQVPSASTSQGGSVFETVPGNSVNSSTSITATSSTASNTLGVAASTNIFGNLGNASPATSDMIFPSMPAASVPTSNIFGSLQTSSIPPSISTSAAATPAANTFFGTPQGPSMTSKSIFGDSKLYSQGIAASTPSVSASAQAASTPSSKVLGASTGANSRPSTAPNSNCFGQANAPSAPTTSKFSFNSTSGTASPSKTSSGTPQPLQSLQSPTPSGLFSNQAQQKAPPKDNLFSSLNMPSVSSGEQSAPAGNNFGTRPASANKTLKGSAPSSAPSTTPENSIFRGLSQETAPSSSLEMLNKPVDPPVNQSPYSQSNPPGRVTPPVATNNTYSPTKPKAIEAPASASQPPPNGMFPSLSHTLKSAMKPSTSSVGGNQLDVIAQMTDASIAHLVPPHFSEDLRRQFYAAYRLRALNATMIEMFRVIPVTQSIKPTIDYYDQQRQLIVNAYGPGLKRKSQNSENQENEAPTGSSAKRNMNDVGRQESDGLHRAKRTPFDLAATTQGKPNGLGTNGHVGATPSKPTSTPLQQIHLPPVTAPQSSSQKSKRKAEEQLTREKHEEGGTSSPLRQIKTPKLNGAGGGSSTSNIFKNILGSPEKKIAGTPKISKEDTPRSNPFAAIQMPSFSAKANVQGASSPTTFSHAAAGTSSSPIKCNSSVPEANEPDPSVAKSPIKPPVFSSGGGDGTNFLNQFSQQAQESEIRLMEKEKQEDMDSEDDEEEWEKNWKKARVEKKKKLEELTKTSSKPPVFSAFKANVSNSGGSTDFLAQFNRQAKDTEKELMLKEKEEDMDSEDDEAEWEENWKKARAEKKKAAEELAKSQRPVFKPGQGFSFSQPEAVKENTSKIGAESSTGLFSSLNSSGTPTPRPISSNPGSVFDGHAFGKPVSNFGSNIFGHLSGSDAESGKDADDESSDGGDDSEKQDPTYEPSGSRPGTPGTPVEDTGAGIASAKKSSLFSLGSSTNSTSSPSGSLFDRISKVPNPSSGDDSEKAKSGTSTPGRSLFDLIDRDGNGNPVRHVLAEEKENTLPSSSTLFGDVKDPFSKSAGSDQTWNVTSPIKFGATTKDSAPSVSVTAATPTKPVSNLFGSSTVPKPAPFTNLFGGTQTSKPTSSLFSNMNGSKSGSSLLGTPGDAKAPASGGVGFGFGGTSTMPSLFPSAAGSANTSRATSPGATTDGSTDADPEAEKHEQIDLTSGGPGEENEDRIYEVRAKALQFMQKDEHGKAMAWIPKGVGPLRVLKHKETGVTRVLLRGDPSGKIVLNKGLLAGIKYEATAKTLKMMTSSDDGKGLETWLLQLKTVESAEELASALESNKPTS